MLKDFPRDGGRERKEKGLTLGFFSFSKWEMGRPSAERGQDFGVFWGEIRSSILVVSTEMSWAAAGEVKWAVSCLSPKFLEKAQLEIYIRELEAYK